MSKRIIFSLGLIVLFTSNAIQSMEGEIENNPQGLYNACRDGDLTTARRLIDRGTEVNAKNPYGYTLLHMFADDGNEEVVKFLINSAIEVNAIDHDGFTPIQLAIIKGHVEVARLLIAAGANVHSKEGESLLHIAEGYEEAEKLMKEVSAHTNNEYGNTLLHHSVFNGHREVTRLLVEAGADVNVKNDQDNSPLYYAAFNGNADVAKLLLAAGAEVNVKNNACNTSLHTAADKNHTEVVKLLLSRVQPLGQFLSAAFKNANGSYEILDLKLFTFLSIIQNVNNADRVGREAFLNSLQSHQGFKKFLEKTPKKNILDFCKSKHLEFLKDFVELKNMNNETALDIALKNFSLDKFSLLRDGQERNREDIVLFLAAAENSLNIDEAEGALRCNVKDGLKIFPLAKLLEIRGRDLRNRLQVVINSLEKMIIKNTNEMLTSECSQIQI